MRNPMRALACGLLLLLVFAAAALAQSALSTDNFSIPQGDGPDARLSALPHFVTVVGGAYFFLPGVRALRYLCSDPSSPRETS